MNYQTTKYRINDSVFHRDCELEKEYGIDDVSLYGYYESDDTIYIIGRIEATRKIKRSFCMMCTIYDDDDDIMETSESNSYGSGLVTSMIEPECFFNGFPFTFSFFGIDKEHIKAIKIYPASSY